MKLVIVDFDPKLIETLYITLPDINIVLNPNSIHYAVRHLVRQKSEGIYTWQEEAAITVEAQEVDEKEELSLFLEWFYSAPTSEEARRRYEEWQSKRLLCYTLGNRLIDLFEAYDEEVFNYFKYKEALRKRNQQKM